MLTVAVYLSPQDLAKVGLTAPEDEILNEDLVKNSLLIGSVEKTLSAGLINKLKTESENLNLKISKDEQETGLLALELSLHLGNL